MKIINISKAFGGKIVLNNCSFDIKKNSITTLIGPNGCGKTTLFNIISKILISDSGRIIYNDKNFTDLSLEKISKLGIARTFQDPQLFKNLTVKEHLVLSIKDNSKFLENFLQKNKLTSAKGKRINQVLKDLNLYHQINTKAADLSGGQRKLLDLAIVLVKDFDLVLLDEPTAGVAPELKRLIAKIVLKLKKQNKTVFLIEHDMNFVTKISDEIIVLDQGKVLAKGKPSKIKNNEEVLKAYFGK